MKAEKLWQALTDRHLLLLSDHLRMVAGKRHSPKRSCYQAYWHLTGICRQMESEVTNDFTKIILDKVIIEQLLRALRAA